MNDLNEALMRGLRFFPEDIEANRGGEFSRRQLERLEISRAFTQQVASGEGGSVGPSPLMTLLFFVMIFAAIGAVMWFTGALQQLSTTLGSLTMPVAGGAAVVIVLFLWYAVRSQRRNVQMYRDIVNTNQSTPRVQSITGTVKGMTRQNHREAHSKPHYYIVVHGLKTIEMLVQEHEMKAFQPGQTYQVYYYEDWGAPFLLTAEVAE